MNRREFLQDGILNTVTVAAWESRPFRETSVGERDAQAHSCSEQVDFGYALAPPHRMTTARPEASEKTLPDVEAGLKSATVSSVTKPARTETGLVVQVPAFINEGEKIRVDASEGAYLSRA